MSDRVRARHYRRHRSEMDAAARKALQLVVADELDATGPIVKIALQAIGDPKYGDQDTDGSHSVAVHSTSMREGRR